MAMRDETGCAGIKALTGFGRNGEPIPVSYQFNSYSHSQHLGWNHKLLVKIVPPLAQAKNVYCTWHSRRSRAGASLSE